MDDKQVYIDGIQLSEGGFENLTYDTSKFSDGIEPIRGLGRIFNDRNLSVIDRVLLEFIVDEERLKSILHVYGMYRTRVVLPLKNEMISKKLEGVIDDKKEVNYVLTMLERIQVKSLPDSDKGFSVVLILSIFNEGLSEAEYEKYLVEKEKAYGLQVTKLKSKVNGIIDSIAGDTGGIKLKAFNKRKLQEFMNYKKALSLVNENYTKLTYMKYLQKVDSDYNKEKDNSSIDITSEKVYQVELISNNNIATIPMHGKPMPFKQHLGIGASSFTVKLILDEDNTSDQKLAGILKSLSQKNLMEHEIIMETPLINVFGFKNASVTNVVFSNSNNNDGGIIVTIQVELNSYETMLKFYDSDITEYTPYGNSGKEYVVETGSVYEEAYGQLLSSFMVDLANTNFDDPNLARSIMSIPVDSNNSRDTLIIKTGESMFLNDQIWAYTGPFNSSPRFYTKKKSGGVKNPTFMLTSESVGRFKSDSKNSYNLDINYTNISNATKFLAVDERFKSFERMHKLAVKSTNGGITAGSDITTYSDPWETMNVMDHLDFVSMYPVLRGEEKAAEFFNSLFDKRPNHYKGFSKQNKYGFSFKDPAIAAYNSETVFPFADDLFLGVANQLDEITTLLIKFLFIDYLNDFHNIITKKLFKHVKGINVFGANGYNKEAVKSISETLVGKVIDTFDGYVKSEVTKNIVIRHTVNMLDSATATSGGDSLYAQAEDKYKEVANFFTKNSFVASGKYVKNKTYNIFISKMLAYTTSYILSGERIGKKVIDRKRLNNIASAYLMSTALYSVVLYHASKFSAAHGYNITATARSIMPRYSAGLKVLEAAINTKAIKVANNVGDTAAQTSLDRLKKIKSYYQDIFYGGVYDSLTEGESISSAKSSAYKDLSTFLGIDFATENSPLKLVGDLFKAKDSRKDTLVAVSDILDKAKKDFLTNSTSATVVDRDIVEKMSALSSNKTINRAIAEELLPDAFFVTNRFGGIRTNDTMKRRQLASKNVFEEFDNLTNSVVFDYTKVLPNYSVWIAKNTYINGYFGTKKYIDFSELASLFNIVSLRISKDSDTKIKTATIVLIDLNKSYSYDAGDAVNVQTTIGELSNSGQAVKQLNVEMGDEIRINEGFESKLKRVFNGYIAGVQQSGNQMIITCSSFASRLYDEAVFVKRSEDSQSWMRRSKECIPLIDGTDYLFEKNEDGTKIEVTPKAVNYNKHLFPDSWSDISTHLSDPHDNELAVSSFNRKNERATSYNVIYEYIQKLGAEKLAPFSITSSFVAQPGSLASSKKDMTSLKEFNFFTESFEVASESNPRLFENLNNIDRDYEVYGFARSGQTKGNELGLATGLYLSNPSSKGYMANSSSLSELHSSFKDRGYVDGAVYKDYKTLGEALNDMENQMIGARWDVREYGDYATLMYGRDNYFYKCSEEEIEVGSKKVDTLSEGIVDSVNTKLSTKSLFGYHDILMKFAAAYRPEYFATELLIYYNDGKVEGTKLKDIVDGKKNIGRFSKSFFAVTGYNLIANDILGREEISNDIKVMYNAKFKEDMNLSLYMYYEKGVAEVSPLANIPNSVLSERIIDDFASSKNFWRPRANEIACQQVVKELKSIYGGKIIILKELDIEIGDTLYIFDDVNKMYGSVAVKSFEHILDRRGSFTVIEPEAKVNVESPVNDYFNYKLSADLSSRLIDAIDKAPKYKKNKRLMDILKAYTEIISEAPLYGSFNEKEDGKQSVAGNNMIPSASPYRLHTVRKRGSDILPFNLKGVAGFSETNVLSTVLGHLRTDLILFKRDITKKALKSLSVAFSFVASFVTFDISTAIGVSKGKYASQYRNALNGQSTIDESDQVRFLRSDNTSIATNTYLDQIAGDEEKTTTSSADYGVSYSEDEEEIADDEFSGDEPIGEVENHGLPSKDTVCFMNMRFFEAYGITSAERKKNKDFYADKINVITEIARRFKVFIGVELYDGYIGKDIGRLKNDIMNTLGPSFDYKLSELDTSGKKEYAIVIFQKHGISNLEVKSKSFKKDTSKKFSIITYRSNDSTSKSNFATGSHKYICAFHNLFGNKGDTVNDYEERKAITSELIKEFKAGYKAYKSPIRLRTRGVIMGDFNLELRNLNDKSGPEPKKELVVSDKELYVTNRFKTTLNKSGGSVSSFDNVIIPTDEKKSTGYGIYRYMLTINPAEAYAKVSDHLPVFAYF